MMDVGLEVRCCSGISSRCLGSVHKSVSEDDHSNYLGDTKLQLNDIVELTNRHLVYIIEIEALRDGLHNEGWKLMGCPGLTGLICPECQQLQEAYELSGS